LHPKASDWGRCPRNTLQSRDAQIIALGYDKRTWAIGHGKQRWRRPALLHCVIKKPLLSQPKRRIVALRMRKVLVVFLEVDRRPAGHRNFVLKAIGVPLMNLTISGHHLEVTPALRNYVTEKLDRITRHFDQVVDVKVLLSIEKQKEKELRQRAECNIHVKGSDMFAESASADLYAAVDDLVDKLDRQVVRHKDRIKNHQHEAPKRLM
jgi:putative sigma-54 modulation protein